VLQFYQKDQQVQEVLEGLILQVDLSLQVLQVDLSLQEVQGIQWLLIHH
jgi:hypothetical protein